MDENLLRSLAAKGDAGAMLAYGISSIYTQEERDLSSAITWCELAGDHGISFGYLAAALLVKEFRPHQNDVLLALLKKGASLGDAAAMHELALAMEASATNNTDLSEAVKWYESAALHSHAVAASRLGDLVDSGALEAVCESSRSAIEWYELAARLGDAHAAFRVSQAYREGIHVERDEGTSRKWLEMSAAQGYSTAHRLIAMAYGLGKWGYLQDASLADFHEKRAEECAKVESIEQEARRRRIQAVNQRLRRVQVE